MKILDKIFKQLEVEAIPAEWYAYEIKRTNQIIRANVEPLEGKLKATAKICDIQERQIEALKERLHNAEKTLIVIDSLHNDSERTSELVHEYFISTDKQALKK